MTKAIYYHAGCAICVEAERSLLPLLDRKQVDFQIIVKGDGGHGIPPCQYSID